MKKRLISLLVVLTLMLPVPVTPVSAASSLSADSAKEFLQFISGNAFYNPSDSDLYYSLLTGKNNSMTLKQSFLGLCYMSMDAHLYEDRLNRLRITLEEDLPQTTKDATLEVVTSSVQDELIESFLEIGDSGDIWEGFNIILNTVFFAFNVRGKARSDYFKAMLGISPDDQFYELKSDTNATLSGVGVDKEMVDEWVFFMYDLEQDVLGTDTTQTPESTTYRIEFNSNCEEVSSVVYHHTPGLGNVIPPTMEREGYLFQGWYYDAACTSSANGNIYINRDITLYASWLSRTQTITFDSNCTEVADIVSHFDVLDTDREFPVMTRPGYAFDGWFMDSACTNPVTTYSSVGNYTFYAKWLPRYTFKTENGGITITDILIADGTDPYNITDTIPSSIHGLPVLKIGDSAFARTANLTSVIIPNTVTHIGAQAFEYCRSLTSVTIPESVTYIGPKAFRETSLYTVSLPDNLTEISDYTFEYCYLRSVKLPKNLRSIGERAFSNCSLREIDLPEGLETIGDFAFANVSLNELILPDSVTTIGESILSGCYSISYIHLGASLSSMHEESLSYCQSLSSITVSEENQHFTAPDGVLYSKDFRTLYCYPPYKQGASYEIKEGCQRVAAYAFFGSSLSSIHMPDSVTSLGTKAFASNGNLKELSLGKGITALPPHLFDTSIIETLILPAGITEIPADAFQYMTQLKTLVFMGKLTSIGNSAFFASHPTNVYTASSEEEWSKVSIGTSNSALTKATMHYGCIYATPTTKVCVSDGVTTVERTVLSEDVGKQLLCVTFKDNRLTSFQNVLCTQGTTPFTITEDYDTIKILEWDNLSDLSPFRNADVIEL